MHAGDKFADDFPVPERMPEEDPDGEDHLSIPLARAAAPGKPSAQEAIQVEYDEDDDDDCQIFDVIDARPLKYALPAVPGPAVTTKRAVSETAHAGGSGTATKKTKTAKRLSDKPPRRRRGPPTMSTGYATLQPSCSIRALPEIPSNLLSKCRAALDVPQSGSPVSRFPGPPVQLGPPLFHHGAEWGMSVIRTLAPSWPMSPFPALLLAWGLRVVSLQ